MASNKAMKHFHVTFQFAVPGHEKLTAEDIARMLQGHLARLVCSGREMTPVRARKAIKPKR